MYVLVLVPTPPPPHPPPFAPAIFHVNSDLGENSRCHLSLFSVHLGAFVKGTQRLFTHANIPFPRSEGRLPTHVHISAITKHLNIIVPPP